MAKTNEHKNNNRNPHPKPLAIYSPFYVPSYDRENKYKSIHFHEIRLYYCYTTNIIKHAAHKVLKEREYIYESNLTLHHIRPLSTLWKASEYKLIG